MDSLLIVIWEWLFAWFVLSVGRLVAGLFVCLLAGFGLMFWFGRVGLFCVVVICLVRVWVIVVMCLVFDVGLFSDLLCLIVWGRML